MFAVVTTVDTIAIVVGTFMFNLVYAELVELHFGGGTFLLSGALAFIPLGILWYVCPNLAATLMQLLLSMTRHTGKMTDQKSILLVMP